MAKISKSTRFLLFLHKRFGLPYQKVMDYSNISRATFFRYKKKVYGLDKQKR